MVVACAEGGFAFREVARGGVQAFCRACDAGGQKLQLSFRTGHCREPGSRSPASEGLMFLKAYFGYKIADKMSSDTQLVSKIIQPLGNEL